MRPGMQCLLELLRGCGFARAYDQQELQAALALAEEEHVLPWAAAQLRARADTLPPAIRERVAEVERAAAIEGFFWSAELKSVLHAFAERGIPVVPLKGPSLAGRVYGNAALRPSRDLDLLVARADWARAEAALEGMGFVAGETDDHHRPWSRQTTKLELHFDAENPLAFDFRVAGALERARPAEFHSEPCRLLAPEDELLYLCLHAARHRYERLSFALDLRLAFEKLATEEWQPRAEVAELSGLIALGLAMARKLEPHLRVGASFEATKSEQQHLDRLAGRLWQRLRTEPFAKRDWGAVHAFYLELEPTRWRRVKRRLRHARILWSRTIDRDRTFAARLGLRREWQVRALRPLRLIVERGGR
jgi:hypothetical protein